MKSLRTPAYLLLVAVVLTVAAPSSLARKARQSSADTAKARYYYLEAATHEAEDLVPESYTLFRKALEIDTGYLEAGFHTGMLSLVGDIPNDTVLPQPSVDLVRRYVDANPTDYLHSLTYMKVSLAMDNPDEAKRVLQRLDTLFPSKTEVLLHLADLYAKTGDLDRGIHYLDRYEKAEGPSPQLALYKISYLIAKGDSAGCLEEADRFYRLNPSSAQNVLFKAQVYNAFEQPDTAFAYMLRAEQLAPQNGAIKTALANYYKEQGDSVAYDTKVYEALLAEDSDLEYKIKTLAEYLQKLLNDKSDTSRGDTLFSALKQQYPHDPQVLDLSARYSAAKGDFEKASDDISYAIDQAPDDRDYHLQLLTYLLQLKDIDRTRRAYDNALTHVGFDRQMAVILASAYFQDEDYDRGTETLGTAIHDVDPSLPIDSLSTDNMLRNHLKYEDLELLGYYYCLIGDMRQKQGRNDLAATAYENSIYYMPIDPMAPNNYAYMLASQNHDIDKAYELSKRAIDLEGDNPTYLDTYAWVLYRQGKYDEAEDVQRRAMALAQDKGIEDVDIFDHYGDILHALGIDDEAVVYWKKALDLDPENKDIQQKLKKK